MQQGGTCGDAFGARLQPGAFLHRKLQHAVLNRRRIGEEVGTREAHLPAGATCDDLVEAGACNVRHVPVKLAENFRRTHQRVRDAGVELFPDNRQKLVPDNIPAMGFGVVGGVISPLQTPGGRIRLNFFACGKEQGTYDPSVITGGRNARQTANAASPQQIKQHRFGVVVGMVAGSDPRAPGIHPDLFQERVPQRAGRILKAPSLPLCLLLHRSRTEMDRDRVKRTQSLYKRRIFFRSAGSETVIEMRDHDRYAAPFTLFRQQVEQHYGVDPAADCRFEPVPGRI